MKVSIIIVSYNAGKFLKPCLKSVFENKAPKEVILVDNASKDDSVDIVKNNFSKVKIIQNDKNVGFASACNQGIEIMKGDYALLLNTDVILKGDSLKKMVSFMNNNRDVGVMGVKLVNEKGELTYSCKRFQTFTNVFLRRTFFGAIFKKQIDDYLMKDYDHKTVKEVDWISGACMLIRKNALKNVGFFDPKFFLYVEDMDLCYRVKKEGVYRVIYNPALRAIHREQRESSKNTRLFLTHLKSFLYFKKKQWFNQV